MNILCNGGPIAAAERINTFLALHGLDREETRILTIGFASGRFPFINIPYGIVPRTSVEAAAWGPLRGKIFRQATEIFLRLLRGDVLNSTMLEPISLQRDDFRSTEDWERVLNGHGIRTDRIEVPGWWRFPDLAIVPRESRKDLLALSIGSHDPATQIFANTICPVGVFNLSITPGKEIEETNERMGNHFHPDGGGWTRRLMPRTVLVFINEEPGLSADQRNRHAADEARAALSNYWSALEGTLDPAKVEKATNNALVGDAETIAAQARERFHPDDRLMLWFDFNNHDNERVKRNMIAFVEKVIPLLGS